MLLVRAPDQEQSPHPLRNAAPESAVNASTWPWEAHKRQYGAFIFAVYLSEQTDADFVRRTWDSIGLFELPLDAIADVVQDYGLYLRDLLQGFSVANYRLVADTAGLSDFVGASVGYGDSHAPGTWRFQLADGRPARAAQRSLTWGSPVSGSTDIYPGGTAYLEFTGPSTGPSRLTVEIEDQRDPRVELHHLLVVWPSVGGAPSATPSRWSRPDPDTGSFSIAVNPGEIATLIVSRTDVIASAGSAEDEFSVAHVAWNATMIAEGAAAPNGTLNAQWSNQATNAKCADWSGGDAIQSVLLPSGKRAWFFSDTFLGDPAKRGTGDQTSLIRNSIVMQDGSSLRTITGGSTCKETDPSTDFWARYAKTPVGEGGQYWTEDSKVVSGGELIKFYYEGVGDQNTHAAYTRLSIADLEADNVLEAAPENLQDCSARPPSPIIWGASLLDHDGYTYIYGWEAQGTDADKALFLARVPNSETLDLVDQQYWRYYAGTASGGEVQWVDSCSAAKPLTPTSEVDFSVIHVNGRFWLVHHTPASQAPGKIVAVPSETPWGFGTAQLDLYTPPETQTNPKYSTVYGARVHENLLKDTGKIAISYTVSKSAANVPCWTRGYFFPDDQYPRFIDVPVTAFFTR